MALGLHGQYTKGVGPYESPLKDSFKGSMAYGFSGGLGYMVYIY